MKKLEKLNSTARDAYITYSAAVDSRTAAYRAWDEHTTPSADCENALAVYTDACSVTDATWATYIAACEAARKADDASKAKAYGAEDNKMNNTNSSPVFIKITTEFQGEIYNETIRVSAISQLRAVNGELEDSNANTLIAVFDESKKKGVQWIKVLELKREIDHLLGTLDYSQS